MKVLTQIKSHRWGSLLNSLPNIAIMAMNHLGSFLPFRPHPLSCYHKYPTQKQGYLYLQIAYFSQPHAFYTSCPLYQWCPLSPGRHDLILQAQTFHFLHQKISIWVRCPQSLLYLLIITLSTLYFEYLSFIQPLSHQLDSTLWGARTGWFWYKAGI